MAWVLACGTFALILARGMATAYDAGLAVVGVVTVALLALLWVYDHRRWMRWMGVAVLVAVAAQGALRGLRGLHIEPVEGANGLHEMNREARLTGLSSTVASKRVPGQTHPTPGAIRSGVEPAPNRCFRSTRSKSSPHR